MTPEELSKRIPESAFRFITSRSSGPGGQNVNKVNTKVEVRLDILNSPYFTGEEKGLIIRKLGKRIHSGGELIVRSQSQRSQYKNKEKAISRMFLLLSEAITEDPVRSPTHPTKASVIKRLEEKRARGNIKRIRKKHEDLTEE